MNIQKHGSNLQLVETKFIPVVEEIEGLDECLSDGWGEYPIDSVFFMQTYRTVRDVVDHMNRGRYVLDSDFNRDFVWSKVSQSELIESCIMRIPLPVFYVAEQIDGRYAVMDGIQRLSTFSAFLNDELKLSFHTKSRKSKMNVLNGKKYSDLAIRMQERIDDTQLTFNIMDSNAPESAKLDVFERVNRGYPMTRQQMRNALFSGQATKWLKSVAGSKAFQIATGGSLNKTHMRDREAINRFVSFALIGWRNYKGDMDNFLAEGLRKLEVLTDKERDELKRKFDQTMNLCFEIFGKHCFRKSILNENKETTVINLPLFEIISSYFVINLNKIKKIENKRIKENIKKLLSDHEFVSSITLSTNSPRLVKYRFKGLEDIFQPDIKDMAK